MAIKGRTDFSDSEIRGFINFAFHDYLAARTLLLASIPTQGTTMAITAFEKLFKAICLLSNQQIVVGRGGHTIKTMATEINKINNGTLNKDDIDFINHIDQGYFLRYPDNFTTPFEFYFPCKRVLENMDRIFCGLIESAPISIFNPDKKMYDVRKKQNDTGLMNRNVHFDSSLQDVLSCEPQYFSHYIWDGNAFTENFFRTDKCRHDIPWNSPLN